jgi:hypothetical protein
MLRTLVRLVALGAAAMILTLLVPLGGAHCPGKDFDPLLIPIYGHRHGSE